MKCPKCSYLGFEPVDRCRNCGYDFSLSSPPDVVELPLKGESESREPLDLSFLDVAMTSEPVVASRNVILERSYAVAVQPTVASSCAALSLFGAPIPDDLPLITKPPPPRPPLAVRRATPELPRLRSLTARAATLDLALEPPPPSEAAVASARSLEEATVPTDDVEDATVGARFVAVVADMFILAAIDAVVIYFTMQICGIAVDELGILPRTPLLAFLVVQNGGYLVAFTAGGQTLGKMVAGIKVVSAEPRSPLDLGRAFVRELVWLVLALPAGLGLLTVLSRDHRGFHDRFAGTRVVRG